MVFVHGLCTNLFAWAAGAETEADAPETEADAPETGAVDRTGAAVDLGNNPAGA